MAKTKQGINQSAKQSIRKGFLFFEIIVALFVATLLISNVASSKIVQLGFLVFDGGTLLFPLAYIFGDVLTEVYGYAKARQVIWMGFGASVLMVAFFYIVQVLPSAQGWDNQAAFELILGVTPRIVLASMIAYLAGSFTNSFIMARMKILTKGKALWKRTIGSTIAGELVDTIIFCSIAFLGTIPATLIIGVIISNYIFKVGVEVLFTPITYKVTGFLKEKEQVDIFDKTTNFNPLKF